MYKTLITLITIITSLKITKEAKSEKSKSPHCTLTKSPSKDPFPSLVKCYKYNNEACCMSVHDDYISNYINSILTEPCLRKYSEFEDLMCFGCHPLEKYYINETNKTIFICEEFAMRLWNATELSELNEPTTIFDNCGFKVDFLEDNSNNYKFIIPSQEWNSFFDFFTEIHIPLYEDYNFVLVPKDGDVSCYNFGYFVKRNFWIIFISFFILV